MTNMESGVSGTVSAQIEAVLAEHGRLAEELGRSSEERAASGVAAASAATARFRRVAERVRQGALERSQPKAKRQELAPDDPLAEFEAQAQALSGPKPDEVDDTEVDDFLDTMLPLAPPPPEPIAEQDTTARQWTKPQHAGSSSSDDDEDFELSW